MYIGITVLSHQTENNLICPDLANSIGSCPAIRRVNKVALDFDDRHAAHCGGSGCGVDRSTVVGSIAHDLVVSP
jgi:hypothetical protein